MSYDEKVTQGFSSVLCTDNLVFLGHLGPYSKISIFKFKNDRSSLKFVGFLSPIIGTVKKLLVTSDKKKLICNTNCGYIYVWDISEETIDKFESLINNPLYIDGYIPLALRVRPDVVIESKNLAQCIDIDLLYNNVIIGVEKWPELTVNLYDCTTGQKLASFQNLLGEVYDKRKYIRCIKADSQLVKEGDEVKGQWVAIGSDKGQLHMVFVPAFDVKDFNVENIDVKLNSFSISENININTIAWRFRNKTSSNLTVICGCSDGTIKCFVLSSGEEKLNMAKQASYLYSKAAISATVNKILCVKDGRTGVPFLIGSCNMIGELGNFEFGDLATNCVFEGVYQKLMQDQSDDVMSFAKVQEYITDLSIAPTNSHVVMVSTNDSVYLCTESMEMSSRTPWSKPVKKGNSLGSLRHIRIYGTRYKIEKIQKLCENFEKACWRSVRIAEEKAYLQKYHFLKHCLTLIKLYRQKGLEAFSAIKPGQDTCKISDLILNMYDGTNSRECLAFATTILEKLIYSVKSNFVTQDSIDEVSEKAGGNVYKSQLIKKINLKSISGKDMDKIKDIVTTLKKRVKLEEDHGRSPEVLGYTKAELEKMIGL
ncbi:uncharacterized protein TOT_010000978 [Theileria orientalis strain Shintoku]|uniref:Uncharacterized protein n=1 Tax=Theileria orientalis strain Shintoku TaxID=869250 RepID=J4C7S0_THEOR|nr:uncharacterized protein TOT_010000978 [Theileria orientalis strain Shintoku]BAM39523.1 uncharacterized protein TOT_010000978 [Theileria orientalis strain Shintoku]|eukprot:XP_009689824.1 uncharacterized protein TOT_010000978 [Theileria orientalis strain Shintoku]